MKAAIQNLCLCGLLASAIGSGGVTAAITPGEAEESSVRIFNIDTVERELMDEQDKPVLNKEGKPVKALMTGFGSGFVVSNQGHIVTNQHVVGDLEDAEHDLWVAHKEGGKVMVYHVPKEGRLWASANQDLAIIQVPDLHCRALVISFFEPIKGTEVYTQGYPGISDSSKGQNEFISHIRGLVGKLESADITEFLAKNKLSAYMVEPSFTSGHITRLSSGPGFEKDGPGIDLIDQDVKTGHGNSGGPLLNPCGEVIGVVGRGKSKDLDTVKWGIRTTELKSAFAEFKVPFTTAPVACTQMLIVSAPSQTKLFIAIGASVFVGAVALLLALLKTKGGRQVAVSYTRVIEAKFKEFMGNRKINFEQGDRPVAPRPRPSPAAVAPSAEAPAPLQSARETWLLQGKTPDGRSIRLEMSEDLFAKNGNRLVLGRSAELCGLHLNDSSVSRQHAQIRKSERNFYVADRNSANGTSINGRRLNQPLHEEPFREGDALTFGEVKLVFRKL